MSSDQVVDDCGVEEDRRISHLYDENWKLARRIKRFEDFIRNGANAINVGMDDPFEAAIQQTLTDSFADGR